MHRAAADGQDAAEALGGEPLLVPDRDVEAGGPADLDGLLGEPGGGLEVGRDGGQGARAPAGAAERDRPGELVVGAVVAHVGQHDAGDRSLRAVRWSASGRRRTPSIAPTTRAPRPSSGAIAGERRDHADAVLRGAGQRRAGAAEVGDRALADADEQHQGHVAVAIGGATGTVVTSPARPVPRAASRAASRSMPRASDASSAPGPSSGPSWSGRTGKAHTSAPPIWCGSAGLSANSGGETWVGSCAVVATISRRRP